METGLKAWFEWLREHEQIISFVVAVIFFLLGCCVNPVFWWGALIACVWGALR